MSNTPTEDRLGELLLRWDELRREGRNLPPEELCADCPELTVELRRRIEIVQDINSVLDVESTRLVPTPEDTVFSGTTGGHMIPHLLSALATYRPERHHAHGGLGEVFSARQEELDRVVALKRIRPDKLHDAARSRFLREAAITARLQHPGIIPIYSLGRDDDGPFYTMPFIHGQTLQEAIDDFHSDDAARSGAGRRTLKLRGLLQHLITACNTAAYAHDQGVVHRDLKPSNIMLGAYGETLVMDWGLAKRVGAGEPAAEINEGAPSPSPSPDHLTATGAVLGTPRYMSPEQAKGEPSTPASDVFSLGVILYAILTGKPAFDEASFRGVDPLKAVREAAVVPPRKRDPRLSRALEAVCLHALAARPADRYASARDLATDLEKWLADEPVTAYAEPRSARLRRWVRRHRAVVQSAIAVLVFVAMSSTVAALMVDRARRAELSAKSQAQANLKMAIETADRERAARSEAEANFTTARDAVDQFYTRVSDETLLNQPHMEHLRKDLLGAARAFYRKFVDQRRSEPRARTDLGLANIRLGKIASDLGEMPEATRHSEQARAVLTEVAAAAPDDPRLQDDLAKSHYALGQIYYLTGRTTEAEQSHQAALTIRRELTSAHPEETQYQTKLASSHNELGILYYRRRGQTTKAEQSHGAALAIRQKLAAAQPETAVFQQVLAYSHGNLGIIYGDTRRTAEAERSYQAALLIQQKLVAAHPEVIRYLIDLAATYQNLGKLNLSSNRLPAAEQAFQASIGIRRKLVESHPDVPKFHLDLARGHNGLGAFYLDTGRVKVAEQSFRTAQDIQQQLLAAYPDSMQSLSDLAMSHNNLGLLYAGAGRLSEAKQSLESSLALKRKLAEAHPEQLDFSVGLANAYCGLGGVVRDQGDSRSALEWYERAIITLQSALHREPRHAEGRRSLMDSHWGRAETLSRLARYSEAIVDWDRAVELSDGKNDDQVRLGRAAAIARSGDHSRAIDEANALSRAATTPNGERCYNLACIFALASAAVARDPLFAGSDRARRAEHLAARAVEHLAAAQSDGYFHKPNSIADLLKDTDLHSLGARPDFRSFLMDVAFPDNPFAH